MKQIPSPNFDDRQTAVDMLVIHYTGRPSLEESLSWLTDPERRVSAHYLVGEKGEVFQLVDEGLRAWHAGTSYWKGVSDINSCSIGIELQNPGLEFGYQDFPEQQIAALINLAKDVIERKAIPANRVLGHSDVAPGRKQDPGEKFPWKRMAGEGIGLWPARFEKLENITQQNLIDALARFGYNPEVPLTDAVTAFQRHWQPENVSGKGDRETARKLLALL